MCCVYAMQQDFAKEHEELAKRLVLAHGLAIQYMYLHPYNASMIFADTFGTTQIVGLRTMYMKCVKEGRTITWEFSEDNIKNRFAQYDKFNIDLMAIERELRSLRQVVREQGARDDC